MAKIYFGEQRKEEREEEQTEEEQSASQHTGTPASQPTSPPANPPANQLASPPFVGNRKLVGGVFEQFLKYHRSSVLFPKISKSWEVSQNSGAGDTSASARAQANVHCLCRDDATSGHPGREGEEAGVPD